MINFKLFVMTILTAALFMACSSKEASPYGEIFKDRQKFIPVNSEKMKEIK